MHLAVLATSRNPLLEPFAGGQESLTAALVKGLRARSHHLHLYAHPDTDPSLADTFFPYPALPNLSSLASAELTPPEAATLRDHSSFAAAISHLISRQGVDAVLNHSLNYLPLAMSPALPTPMLTTLHTPPFPWMELGVGLASPKCRYVVVSAMMTSLWTTLTRPPQVIRNGVDPADFPLANGGPDLVWVGRITPEKGTDLAIATARKAGRRLRIVGPVSDREWFDRAVAPQLGSDVEYLGHLTHQQAAQVVGASAVCLVTPRWDEPFGLVAVEAMLCGTPVVAVHRGGLGEVVLEGTGALVAEDSRSAAMPSLAEELAAAIPQAEQLPRETVRHVALRHHSFDRMVDEYEAAIRALVAPSHLRPRKQPRGAHPLIHTKVSTDVLPDFTSHQVSAAHPVAT